MSHPEHDTPADTEALPVTEDTAVMPVVPEPADTIPFLGANNIGLAEPRPFPYIAIGDHLISSMPGFDTLPCGHCGAVFDGAPPDVLTRVRPLGVLRHLAYEAGWQYDLWLAWCCPRCQESADERAAEADRKWAEAARIVGVSDVLGEFDRKAKATLAKVDGEFNPSRWRYVADAPPAEWRAA
ncbi:MAG TPA: hypothetical protein VGS62_10770 [Streptosporangiaceae bacterium]|nr:hypothetical protein [Streptosporangiaceae bacterium]